MHLHRHIFLAAKPAANQAVDHADALFRHVERSRNLFTVAKWNLAAAVHGQPAVCLRHRQRSLRLNERVLHKLRAVFALHNHIRLSKALVHIAILKVILRLEVSGGVMRVQQHCVRLRGLLWPADYRQQRVVHINQLQCARCNVFRLRHHQRDGIAHIAHLVVTQHRPVNLVHAAVFAAGNIRSRKHGHHAGQHFGAAHIHMVQQRVRMRTAQRTRIQHAFHVQVIRIDARTGYLCNGIRARQRTADGIERLLYGGQRGHRLPGCLLNGAQNCVVARAAADVELVPVINFCKRGIRMLVQQGFGSHDESRCAEAALGCALVNVGLLNWVKRAVGQPFNSCDVRVV